MVCPLIEKAIKNNKVIKEQRLNIKGEFVILIHKNTALGRIPEEIKLDELFVMLEFCESAITVRGLPKLPVLVHFPINLEPKSSVCNQAQTCNLPGNFGKPLLPEGLYFFLFDLMVFGFFSGK